MKKTILAFFIVIALTSCEQNPLNEAPALTQKKPDVRTDSRTTTFGLFAPAIVEFLEGTETSFIIDAWVPEPGRPIITVFGLPDGARFIPEESRIVWKPPYTAANDPSNPSIVVRNYTIEIEVKSSSDTITAPIRRLIVLSVKDIPQNFGFQIGTSRANMHLSQEFTQNISILSDDFPMGPFIVEAEGLPATAVMDFGKSRNQFVVRFTPSENDVGENDPWHDTCTPWANHFGCHQRIVTIHFKATNLRGQQINSPPVYWIISDIVKAGD